MKHIHRQEKQQFKKLFKQEYIDVFEDRFNILEIFLQTEKHLTIDELINLLKENGNNQQLSRATQSPVNFSYNIQAKWMMVANPGKQLLVQLDLNLHFRSDDADGKAMSV